MKRHLSTCHGLQDDDLRDGCIDKLKYKDAIDLRLENLCRNKRSKNLQVSLNNREKIFFLSSLRNFIYLVGFNEYFSFNIIHKHVQHMPHALNY